MVTTVYESATMYVLLSMGYVLIRITRDGKAVMKQGGAA